VQQEVGVQVDGLIVERGHGEFGRPEHRRVAERAADRDEELLAVGDGGATPRMVVDGSGGARKRMKKANFSTSLIAVVPVAASTSVVSLGTVLKLAGFFAFLRKELVADACSTL